MTNRYNEEQATAWQALQTEKNIHVTTLEELCKFANTIMPRVALQGMSAYETCFLYPYSEYQIPKSCDDLTTPHVRVTYFDRFMAFDTRHLKTSLKIMHSIRWLQR